MQLFQTATFRKAVKRLHANQKRDLDEVVKVIAADPDIGEAKIGDLASVQIYKFKMVKQPVLLACIYEGEIKTVTLIALGSHENFYCGLRKPVR